MVVRESEIQWLREDFGLTPKELQVTALLLEGLSSKAMANELNISVPTVEVHRAHIRRKLDARNTAQVFRAVMAGSYHRSLTKVTLTTQSVELINSYN